MIPVTQTKVVVRNSEDKIVVYGNCFAAVVASLLEVPIDQVPNVEIFFDTNFDYYWLMNAWLYQRYGLKIVPAPEFEIFHEGFKEGERYDSEANSIRLKLGDEFYLGSGVSRRGVYHICIYQGGELVWDPHPTREGLIKVESIEKLVKLSE